MAQALLSHRSDDLYVKCMMNYVLVIVSASNRFQDRMALPDKASSCGSSQ